MASKPIDKNVNVFGHEPGKRRPLSIVKVVFFSQCPDIKIADLESYLDA